MKVSFPCCFCEKEIAETDIDPCHVMVATVDGRKQYWSCHAACFKGALSQGDLKMLFEPALF